MSLTFCTGCGGEVTDLYCANCGRRAEEAGARYTPRAFAVGNGNYTCSSGHTSLAFDFCDVCGIRIDQVPAGLLEEVSLDDNPPSRQLAGQTRVAVVAAAERVALISVRVLPAADRVRYAEEFAGELYDLTCRGAGRWRQAAYALRVASRVWVLRIELTTRARREVRS